MTVRKITACLRKQKQQDGRKKPRDCQFKSHDRNKMAATASVFAGRARAGSSRLPVQRDADGNEAEVEQS